MTVEVRIMTDFMNLIMSSGVANMLAATSRLYSSDSYIDTGIQAFQQSSPSGVCPVYQNPRTSVTAEGLDLPMAHMSCTSIVCHVVPSAAIPNLPPIWRQDCIS